MSARDFWLADYRFSFRAASRDIAVIKGITGEQSVEAIMAELRAEHPEEAMLLGEWIVLDGAGSSADRKETGDTP